MRIASVVLCIAALLTACGHDMAASPAEKEARSEQVSQNLPGRDDALSRAKVSADASGFAKAETPAPVAPGASGTQMPSIHTTSDSIVSSMIIRTG